MTISYSSPTRRFDSTDYSFEEVRELIGTLSMPGTTVITTMPCGVGLDFHAEEHGRVWLEFYADGLHAATVGLSTAQQVFDRAVSISALSDPKSTFGDLISTWDY